MSSLARSKTSKHFNPSCADLVQMAERELSAFFHAVTQLFGSDQARQSAEDWLQELIEIDGLPASTHEWRLITTKISARLASRLSASSLASCLSTELQIA